MKVKFSKIERTAGLFVVFAFGVFLFATAIIAVKQGWFSKRYHYTTKFSQGEGLHPGTLVQISGLRAGSVDSVILDEENHIRVSVTVTHEFAKKIRQDSVAKVIRPFIIGDKVVEITVGSNETQVIADNGMVVGEDTMDVMDLVGGGRLGPILQTLDNLMSNVKMIAQAFADPKRSEAFIKFYDELLPTMRDFREVSVEMTHNKGMRKTLESMVKLTEQMNDVLPQIAEFSKHLPELGEDGAKTMAEMSKMTEELNKILPILAQVAPQLPQVSQQGIDALKEAVIVLRAMQKSFLLRGSVKDVKEEDAKKQEELDKKQLQPSDKREPASK